VRRFAIGSVNAAAFFRHGDDRDPSDRLLIEQTRVEQLNSVSRGAPESLRNLGALASVRSGLARTWQLGSSVEFLPNINDIKGGPTGQFARDHSCAILLTNS
jgi:hypothetical protein